MSKRRKKTFQKEVEQKRSSRFFRGLIDNDAKLLKRVGDCWKEQSEFYARKRK